MTRLEEIKPHIAKMVLAVKLLRALHSDNLETARSLASWACILDQSGRDLLSPIEALPTLETFLRYEPFAVSSMMDKIHNCFFNKTVTHVRDLTVKCVESCDLISELLPLIQDQDQAICI